MLLILCVSVYMCVCDLYANLCATACQCTHAAIRENFKCLVLLLGLTPMSLELGKHTSSSNDPSVSIIGTVWDYRHMNEQGFLCKGWDLNSGVMFGLLPLCHLSSLSWFVFCYVCLFSAVVVFFSICFAVVLF